MDVNEKKEVEKRVWSDSVAGNVITSGLNGGAYMSS